LRNIIKPEVIPESKTTPLTAAKLPAKTDIEITLKLLTQLCYVTKILKSNSRIFTETSDS